MLEPQSVVLNGRKYYIDNNSLDLSGLGIVSILHIQGLESLTELKSLNLRDNRLTKIEGLEHLWSLECLIISHNQIRQIEGLENLIELKHLDLRGNRIEGLQGLPFLKNLQNFFISNNPLRTLDGLEQLNHVRHVHLRPNEIFKQEVYCELAHLPRREIVERLEEVREYFQFKAVLDDIRQYSSKDLQLRKLFEVLEKSTNSSSTDEAFDLLYQIGRKEAWILLRLEEMLTLNRYSSHTSKILRILVHYYLTEWHEPLLEVFEKNKSSSYSYDEKILVRELRSENSDLARTLLRHVGKIKMQNLLKEIEELKRTYLKSKETTTLVELEETQNADDSWFVKSEISNIKKLTNAREFEVAEAACLETIKFAEPVYITQGRIENVVWYGRLWYRLGKVYLLQKRYIECFRCFCEALEDWGLLEDEDMLEIWDDFCRLEYTLSQSAEFGEFVEKWRGLLGRWSGEVISGLRAIYGKFSDGIKIKIWDKSGLEKWGDIT